MGLKKKLRKRKSGPTIIKINKKSNNNERNYINYYLLFTKPKICKTLGEKCKQCLN